MSGWAIDTLVATALLMVLVLLLRGPVARLFGARAAYALWLAPALRLLLPPLPPAAVPVPAAVPSGLSEIVIARAPDTSVPLVVLLAAVWLVGAGIFLAVQWLRHERFLADALAHGRALHIDGVPYDVVASTRIDGPMATGLVHPLILVPDDFQERFTREQQGFALLHEQLHHRRGDIWASAAALLLASLHWFNPIAHVALRAFRRDMESACDASVVDLAGKAAASDYAQTILRCASRPAPRSLCALTSIDELKGRLKMIKLNHGKVRRAAGMTLAAAFALGAIATASVAQEKATEGAREYVHKTKIREIAGSPKELRLGERTLIDRQRLADKCGADKFEATSAGGTDKQKEKISYFICAEKGESLLAALEKAVVDLEKDTEMSAERKAEILGKIRTRITELRIKG